MFYQIFYSPQVKRCAIITYKHGIYEVASRVAERLKTFVDGGLSAHTRIKKKKNLNILVPHKNPPRHADAGPSAHTRKKKRLKYSVSYCSPKQLIVTLFALCIFILTLH